MSPRKSSDAVHAAGRPMACVVYSCGGDVWYGVRGRVRVRAGVTLVSRVDVSRVIAV